MMAGALEMTVHVSVRAEMAIAQLKMLADYCAAIDARQPIWQQNIHLHALEAVAEVASMGERARAELGLERAAQVVRIEVVPQLATEARGIPGHPGVTSISELVKK